MYNSLYDNNWKNLDIKQANKMTKDITIKIAKRKQNVIKTIEIVATRIAKQEQKT